MPYLALLAIDICPMLDAHHLHAVERIVNSIKNAILTKSAAVKTSQVFAKRLSEFTRIDYQWSSYAVYGSERYREREPLMKIPSGRRGHL